MTTAPRTRAVRPRDPRPDRRESDRRDRGSVVLWVAITTPALLLTVMLIVDGAAKIRAAEQADTYAGEAARAAAIAVGPRPAGAATDARAASSAATAFLDRAGVTGTVKISGPAAVTVTVQVTTIAPISGVRLHLHPKRDRATAHRPHQRTAPMTAHHAHATPHRRRPPRRQPARTVVTRASSSVSPPC